MLFARTLTIYRQSRGLSQAELAERMGASCPEKASHVNQLERGHRRASPQLATRIARILEVPPWRMLAPLVEEMQDAMCTRQERTHAVVGMTAFARSMSEDEWLNL